MEEFGFQIVRVDTVQLKMTLKKFEIKESMRRYSTDSKYSQDINESIFFTK